MNMLAVTYSHLLQDLAICMQIGRPASCCCLTICSAVHYCRYVVRLLLLWLERLQELLCLLLVTTLYCHRQLLAAVWIDTHYEYCCLARLPCLDETKNATQL